MTAPPAGNRPATGRRGWGRPRQPRLLICVGRRWKKPQRHTRVRVPIGMAKVRAWVPAKDQDHGHPPGLR